MGDRRRRHDPAQGRETSIAGSSGPQPASETKDVAELLYTLPSLGCTLMLKQDSTGGSTTGTTLWLSSQVLACYVQAHYSADRFRPQRADGRQAAPHAVELGAGIGLLSLVMSRLGWRVSATDVEPVLSECLATNIERNVQRGDDQRAPVVTGALDWMGDEDVRRYSPCSLVISADTVYEPELVKGLFKTIAFLLKHGGEPDGLGDEGNAKPDRPKNRRHALIALERRDSGQIDRALEEARQAHGLRFEQVRHRLVRKAVDEHMGARWPREAWEGVEIWRIDYAWADADH